MSYATKRKIMNSSVYIVLGLVITAVLCVSVATVVGMKNKKIPSETVTEAETTSVGLFDPSTVPARETPDKTPDKATDKATGKTPSNDGGGKQVVDIVTPVYCLPSDGGVLKEYSPSQPIKSLTMNDYRTHNGVDISAPLGSPVSSVADGTVLDVYSDPMMGMCVSIDHGEGLVSSYKNLSYDLPEGIAKGVKVRAGQTIGAVGDTSLIEIAEAEHLHFEMTKNGKSVDPGAYLALPALSADVGSE